MASKSQRKATRTHRRRAAARGFARVEVQALKKDAGLIRALAETLRGGPEKAEALRSTLAKAVMTPEMRTAFDIFGSELPDEVFTGVFDRRVNEVGAGLICEIFAGHERHFRNPQARPRPSKRCPLGYAHTGR
jgi:hypothetical protein